MYEIYIYIYTNQHKSCFTPVAWLKTYTIYKADLDTEMNIYIYIYIRFLFKHFCLQPFFLKDWVSLLFTKSVSPEILPWWAVKGEILIFGSLDPWKMHLQHSFWLQRASCPWLINTIFSHEYYGLEIKRTKSHHPNRCIKVGNKPPKVALFVVHTIFFVTRHDRVIRSCLVQTFSFYLWANIVQFQ